MLAEVVATVALQAQLARMSPAEKAAALVVSGLPAPRGAGGVFVRRWNRGDPRPRRALVFVDQEGGAVRAFPAAPPALPAVAYRSAGAAYAAGRATGRALRRLGVHVDLAPVLDASSGPLGSRHFRSATIALAFADGLRAGGVVACVKHFPGLGTAPVSTDHAPRVWARVTRGELRTFRRAVRREVGCVMTSHALYERFGGERAVTAPGAYRLLRSWGFGGIAVTDSLSVVRSGGWHVRWAVRAASAGADLLLFTSPAHARRAIRALLPLARRGALDDAVRRVYALRRALVPDG